MSQSTPPAVSIVGIAPTDMGDVAVLLNVYELPMAVDGIASVVLDQTVHEGGFHGRTRYSVDEWLTGISFAQGTTYACSMEGTLHVSSAATTQWTTFATGARSGFNGVHAVDASLAYAVAVDGAVWSLQGGDAREVMAGSGVRLNAIHGCSAQCIYAVGDDGQVVVFDGVRWVRQPGVTSVNLLAIHCVRADEVYVSGTNGVVLRWDGATWQVLQGPDAVISSLAMYHGRLHAAAGKHGIHALDGATLIQLKPVTIYKLAVANDLLFATGAAFFAWFNGEQWRGGQLGLE